MDKKKKSPKKSSAPKIKDLDAQQRKLAIIKQKKSDAIALHIVKKLIDCPVEEDVFLLSLKYLNQCHYEDIVEERAISKLCGYPICGNQIIDVPTKKFHISTKTNKVYDITERKNYCSNFCYKAGVHIKDQMLSSPLWFRDKEEIPEFNLLPKTEIGLPGQEIDQGLIKLDVHEDNNFTSISEFAKDVMKEIPDDICDKINVENISEDKKEEKIVTDECLINLYAPSLAQILQENAEYFNNDETVTNKSENKLFENKNLETDKPICSNDKTVTNELLKNQNLETEKPVENYKVGFNRTVINTKVSGEQKSKGILKKSKDKKSEKKRVSFTSENSVKILEETDKTDPNKQFKKPETSKTDENNGRRYKNTNVIGVVQERSTIFTSKVTEKSPKENCENSEKNSKESRLSRLKSSSTFKKAQLSKQPSKATSNFSDLKSRLDKCLSEWFTTETALFLYGEDQVKTIISEKSFKHYLNKKKNLELDGNKQKQYEEICKRLSLMELADRKFDATVTGKNRGPLPRYEDIREASELQDLRVQAFYSGCYEMYEDEVEDTDADTDTEDKSEVVQGPPAVLPLIDNKDVMGTRRKIFLMSVSRAISTVCEILQDSPNKLLSEIKHLINTFEFTATNIVFKTTEWQLVTLLLIHILSVRDTELQKVLVSKESSQYLSTLRVMFDLPEQYIEKVLNKVKIEILLEECLRKDCKE